MSLRSQMPSVRLLTLFWKATVRVHIDPTQDGAEVVNAVLDRVRAELSSAHWLGDLLAPRHLTTIAKRL